MSVDRRQFYLFGKMLEYPDPDLSKYVSEAIDSTGGNAEASEALVAFGDFVASCEPGRIEEVYSETFDLNPARYPYAGYHLCGESYKRSVFMVSLSELYEEQGFDCGVELPDHIAVLLRFIATTDDESIAEDLLEEAVLPTAERLVTGRGAPVEHSDGCGQSLMKIEPMPEDEVRMPRPYDPVLVALLSVLKARVKAAA